MRKSTLNIFLVIVISNLFVACSTSQSPYVYDDLYYSPNNDPVKQVQNNPREEFNKTDNITYDGSYPNRYNENERSENYPQSLYQNRYTENERNENSISTPSTSDITINNNISSNNNETEYYDEEYASTLQRINRPIQTFNTYDPYLRDRILLTNDPFFYSPGFYRSNLFWDPWTPRTGISLGWNSWTGWNVGVGVGFGFNNWNYCPVYDPFFSPFGPYAFNGWNNWGWNNWGWNAWNPWNPWRPAGGAYWAGFNDGYNNANFNNNFIGNGNSFQGRSRINTSVSRGSKGSRSLSNSSTRQSINRSGSNINSSRVKGSGDHLNEMNRDVSRSSNRYSNSGSNTTNEKSNQVPSRYQSTKTPATYGNQRSSSRTSTPNNGTNNRSNTNTNNVQRSNNFQSTPSRSNQIQSSPSRQNTYTRPRTNTYNQNNRIQPRRNVVRSPSRNNSTYQRSRPTYNSRPSYTPSRSSGGSSGGSRGSSGSRSRRR